MEAELARVQLKRLLDDNKARKVFSVIIFAITVLWMFLVLIIVVQCSRKVFHLSDGVLIALDYHHHRQCVWLLLCGRELPV